MAAEVVLLVPGLLSVLPIQRQAIGKRHLALTSLRTGLSDQISARCRPSSIATGVVLSGTPVRRLLAGTNPTEDSSATVRPFSTILLGHFGAESRRALTGREASVTRIEEAFAPRDVAGWSHLSFYCHGR